MESPENVPKISDHAKVAFPPPALLVIMILLGFLLEWLAPWRFSIYGDLHLVIGLLIIIASLAWIGLPAFLTMRRMKTNPSPYAPTTALVEKSSFRFTRNPLYLSMLLIITGVAVLANSVWLLVMAVLFFILIQELVIKREEKYLMGKFGESYKNYCSRVRRWI